MTLRGLGDRVVFGATCCWWDAMGAAATTVTGLPCCPHCGGELYEVSIATWWQFARWAGEERRDPYYLTFLEWLRGQCFPHVSVARVAFEERGLQ